MKRNELKHLGLFLLLSSKSRSNRSAVLDTVAVGDKAGARILDEKVCYQQLWARSIPSMSRSTDDSSISTQLWMKKKLRRLEIPLLLRTFRRLFEAKAHS